MATAIIRGKTVVEPIKLDPFELWLINSSSSWLSNSPTCQNQKFPNWAAHSFTTAFPPSISQTSPKTTQSPIHHLIVIYLSVGYTTSDVLYRWNDRAVVISDDLRMSQFDLIGVPSSNETFRVGSEKDEKTFCE
jgi:hypothetical protein